MDAYDLAARGENEGLWDWNLVTSRIHFSPRWISMLGCEQHEIGNTPEEWFQRVHPEDLEKVRLGIESHLAGNLGELEIRHRMLHKDGTYRWVCCRGLIMRDERGQAIRMAGSHSDVTAEIVVDALTGLPNRLLLLDRLTRSVERVKRHSELLFAVLIVDLDRFRSLVERLGSPACDKLLIALARRLETCLRAGDTVARLGHDHLVARLEGDEFIILLDGLNQVDEAKTVAARLLEKIGAPFDICGHEVFLSASVGIALSITGYSRPEDVLRDADVAMYRAKELGGARCEVFDTAILESAKVRLQTEEDLEGALRRREFVVFYQPIISLVSGRIAGFEALVRWNRPGSGLVPPQEFVPIAERTGLILPLGQWVLFEACRQLKAWQDDLGIPRELWMSVNFSSLQLAQPSLVDRVGGVLNDVNLDPHCLKLELTESVMLENPEAVITLLMKLRVLGIHIGLDDFGTGYSSLNYLRKLPLDFLKIDRSFVRRIGTCGNSAEIVQTIGGLAHQLGILLVAEGIETTAELDLIRSINCEYGQGFLFSRPVDGEKAAAMLRAGPLRCPGTKAEAETAQEPSHCLPEASLACVVDLPPDAPMERKRERYTRRLRPLSLVLATLVPFLMGGLIIRCRSKAPFPSEYSPQPGLQRQQEISASPAIAGPIKQTPGQVPATSAPKAAGLEDKARTPAASETASAGVRPEKTTSRKNTPPAAAKELAVSPAKRSRTYTFPVIHNHVLGSCKGILKIARNVLSYIPDKEKDGFTLKYGEFSFSSSNERLTITAGSKTYRFKSAIVRGKEESRLQIQKMTQALSTLRPDL